MRICFSVGFGSLSSIPTHSYRSTSYDSPALVDMLEVITASRLDGVDRHFLATTWQRCLTKEMEMALLIVYHIKYRLCKPGKYRHTSYVKSVTRELLLQSIHSYTLDERLLPLHFPSQACSTMSLCEILKQSKPEPSMGTQVVRCWYPACFASRWLRNLLHSSCQIATTYIAFRPTATFRNHLDGTTN